MPDPAREGRKFRRAPGFRPPWWPEDEPFPPRRPGGWPGSRRHFVRRVGLAVAVFGGFGHRERPGLGPAVAILALGMIVAVVAARRAVRRVAGTVGDVMEAADRVAGGDYRARVDERGSLEMRRLAR